MTEKQKNKTGKSVLRGLARYFFQRMRPPRKMTVSEWADRYRVLSTDYSAEPGKWRTSRAPYQKEIMDAFNQPEVWQIVVLSSSQVGKALDISTPIPTPDGWRVMRDIMPGDYVYGSDGKPCEVLAISDIQENRPCFELTFSDGSKIVADADHKWQVELDGKPPVPVVKTTAEMLVNFKRGNRNTYAIPACRFGERRRIVDIRPVESRPVKCIAVNSEDHLYLAGETMIPTHNSEITINMMGYAIDNDPGPILYVQPTEGMAEDYSKRRIAPMIAACSTLSEKVYKAKGRDAANTISMKTFPGGSLAIIGANSPAELASRPVRYIFLDETDRFPVSAGSEGDPQELAIRRTETFRHNRKIVKTSTPTIKGKSRIEEDYMNGTQEEWHTECPYCHEYNFIRFDDIKFEKEEFKSKNGDKNYNVLSVGWVCPSCKKLVLEHVAKRQPAKWVVKNPKALDNGIRSFRLNAFMSPWSDWKDIVLTFLKAGKDPSKLQVFHNTVLGESWEIHSSSGMENVLYQRREHYDAEVPTGVLLLTMGMDTQDNRLEYEVVGWDRDGQSWGISRGVIPGRADAQGVWDEVDLLLDREWKMANGMKMRILATFIDSGGHHTSAIYRECARRQTRRIWPIKGEKGEGKPECRPMRKGGGKADAPKFMLGVDAGKEGIMYEAGIEEPGPHYMHFPLDQRAGYDKEFFRGLLSEKMVIHRRGGQAVITWEVTHERNEPLDCRNYARAAYRYFNWHFDHLEKVINGEDESIVLPSAEREKRKRKRIVSKGIQI